MLRQVHFVCKVPIGAQPEYDVEAEHAHIFKGRFLICLHLDGTEPHWHCHGEVDDTFTKKSLKDHITQANASHPKVHKFLADNPDYDEKTQFRSKPRPVIAKVNADADEQGFQYCMHDGRHTVVACRGFTDEDLDDLFEASEAARKAKKEGLSTHLGKRKERPEGDSYTVHARIARDAYEYMRDGARFIVIPNVKMQVYNHFVQAEYKTAEDETYLSSKFIL